MRGARPGLLVCANHPDAPGQLTEVKAQGTCRNFCTRRDCPVRLKPPEPPNDQVRYIALTQGKFALVDAADYEWLNQYKWCVSRSKHGGCYAVRNEGGRTIKMHRQIMNPPKGMVVDHIDRNGLDNTRRNLRNCTPAQNARNQESKRGASQYKGVYYSRKARKWVAQICVDRRRITIGSFHSEIEAARAYDRKARELFGQFAYLNFPEEH